MSTPEGFPKERPLTGEGADERLVLELCSYGAKVTGDPFVRDAYIARFASEDSATTTVRLALHDAQSGADVTITNMTTLPEGARSRGNGTTAIKSIIEWAEKNDLKKIYATQVSGEKSADFWTGNGFEYDDGPNSFNDYVYHVRGE